MNNIEIILMIVGVGYLFTEKFFKTEKDDQTPYSKATKTGKVLLYVFKTKTPFYKKMQLLLQNLSLDFGC